MLWNSPNSETLKKRHAENVIVHWLDQLNPKRTWGKLQGIYWILKTFENKLVNNNTRFFFPTEITPAPSPIGQQPCIDPWKCRKVFQPTIKQPDMNSVPWHHGKTIKLHKNASSAMLLEWWSSLDNLSSEKLKKKKNFSLLIRLRVFLFPLVPSLAA